MQGVRRRSVFRRRRQNLTDYRRRLKLTSWKTSKKTVLEFQTLEQHVNLQLQS